MELKTVLEALTGKTKPVQYNEIDALITDAAPLLFDFNYPIFDTSYKTGLQEKIIKFYLFYEICDTPVPRWKIWLANRMNEIMPYYNQLYSSEKLKVDPFSTMNYYRSGNRDGNITTSRTDEENSMYNRDLTSVGKTTNIDTSKTTNKSSDTPQGAITDLESGKYMSAASITDGTDSTTVDTNTNNTENGNSNRDFSSNENKDSTDHYLETIIGFNGKTQSEMVKLYRETFLNIDRMILDDLHSLFMGVL